MASDQNDDILTSYPGGSSRPETLYRALKPPPLAELHVQNVVSTVKVGCSLDLHFIALTAPNVEFQPKRHNSLKMRIRKPRTTALIFEKGSIICVGAKSVEQSLTATRRFTRILQKTGFPVRLLDFRIHNIVASCSVFPLDLEQLVKNNPDRCRFHIYEDENTLSETPRSCSGIKRRFPGAFFTVWRGLTATIHSSGKLHFSGGKTESEIREAFEIIYPELEEVRKTPRPESVRGTEKPVQLQQRWCPSKTQTETSPPQFPCTGAIGDFGPHKEIHLWDMLPQATPNFLNYWNPTPRPESDLSFESFDSINPTAPFWNHE